LLFCAPSTLLITVYVTQCAVINVVSVMLFRFLSAFDVSAWPQATWGWCESSASSRWLDWLNRR